MLFILPLILTLAPVRNLHNGMRLHLDEIRFKLSDLPLYSQGLAIGVWILLFLDHQNSKSSSLLPLLKSPRDSKNERHLFFLNVFDFSKFVETLNITNWNTKKEETKISRKGVGKISLSLSLLLFVFSKLFSPLYRNTLYRIYIFCLLWSLLFIEVCCIVLMEWVTSNLLIMRNY